MAQKVVKTEKVAKTKIINRICPKNHILKLLTKNPYGNEDEGIECEKCLRDFVPSAKEPFFNCLECSYDLC